MEAAGASERADDPGKDDVRAGWIVTRGTALPMEEESEKNTT